MNLGLFHPELIDDAWLDPEIAQPAALWDRSLIASATVADEIDVDSATIEPTYGSVGVQVNRQIAVAALALPPTLAAVAVTSAREIAVAALAIEPVYRAVDVEASTDEEPEAEVESPRMLKPLTQGLIRPLILKL